MCLCCQGGGRVSQSNAAHIQHTDIWTNPKSCFNRNPHLHRSHKDWHRRPHQTCSSIVFFPPPHFLCWALTDTHTWLKTVHYQHDTAGLNGAGLITAIMERITGVHTKKKSIHKCTGRRLLLEHIQGTSATKKKKKKNYWGANMIWIR